MIHESEIMDHALKPASIATAIRNPVNNSALRVPIGVVDDILLIGWRHTSGNGCAKSGKEHKGDYNGPHV